MFNQASQQLSTDPADIDESLFSPAGDQDRTPDPSEFEDVASGQGEAPEEAQERTFPGYMGEYHPMYADPYEDTVELAIAPPTPDSV